MTSDLTAVSQRVADLQKTTQKKLAIYTCVTDKYSNVLPVPKALTDKFDCLLLSDQECVVEGWTHFKWNRSHEDPRRDAKFCKVNPHEILTAYEVSIWVDGNFELFAGINELVETFLNSDETMLLFRHRSRKCVYAEARECLKWGKDSYALIKEQINKYKTSGHPCDWGLFMGGFLMRKHKSPDCIVTMQEWWREIESHSVRDQLSLPVVLRRLSTNILVLPHGLTGTYFDILPHSKYRSSCLTGRNLLNPYAILAPLIYRIATKYNKILKRQV
jgi:hypothetical protein